MFIGSDFYWVFATGRVQHGTGSLVAMETKLGWVSSGMKETDVGERVDSINFIHLHCLRVGYEHVKDETFKTDLTSFWDLETMGVRDDEKGSQDMFFDTISRR